MTSSLVRTQPSLHHALSLDHLHPGAVVYPATHVYGFEPYHHSADSYVVETGSHQHQPEFEGVTSRTWKVKRKMSIPRLPQVPNRRSSLEATSTSVRPAPRSRLSLTNLMTSSRLLRRLSTSPTSERPPPQPIAFSPTRTGSKEAVALGEGRPQQSRSSRPPIARSSTLPSLPSLDMGWELIEGDEVLSEEPASIGAGEKPIPGLGYDTLISPQDASVLPRRIPMASTAVHHSPRDIPTLTMPTSTSTSESAPSSPCQRVWLCTPPRPVASPVLAGPRPQRRPALTTRAISTARLANEFDENGAIVHISVHSERVLAKGSVAKSASCWREKYACCPDEDERAEMGLALARSQSAALPEMSALMGVGGRPGHARADTTGHAMGLGASASTSALGDKGGWARESSSREPLLEAGENLEELVGCIGKRRSWKALKDE